MSRLPRLASSLAPVVLLLATAAIARAEEGEQPAYGRQDLAFADEHVPAGWRLLPEDDAAKVPAAVALAALLDDAGKEASVPKTDRDTLVQAIDKGGTVAVLAFVDVWVEPKAFAAAVRARAEKAEAVVREMAHPTRLLVVSAPAAVREEVVAAATRIGARRLAKQAFESLSGGSGDGADAYAKASLALEPSGAAARLVHGVVVALTDVKDAEARTKGLAEIRAALAEGANPPLDANERTAGLDYLARVLLEVRTPEADTEARDTLKKVLATPGDLSKRGIAGVRYNLACAHGRLKEVDPAFEHLRAVLEVHKESPLDGIHHWRDDPDFANLKSDARWAKLLTDFESTPPTPERAE